MMVRMLADLVASQSFDVGGTGYKWLPNREQGETHRMFATETPRHRDIPSKNSVAQWLMDPTLAF